MGPLAHAEGGVGDIGVFLRLVAFAAEFVLGHGADAGHVGDVRRGPEDHAGILEGRGDVAGQEEGGGGGVLERPSLHLDLAFPPALARVEGCRFAVEFEYRVVHVEMETRGKGVDHDAGFMRPDHYQGVASVCEKSVSFDAAAPWVEFD